MNTEEEQRGKRCGDGLHAGLTFQIVGAAQRVHRVLGSGFLEHVYENAPVIELTESGLAVARQAPIEVHYREQVVGVFRADVLVSNLVIVEIKAIEKLHVVHEVQLVNYLRAITIEVGLLLNFGTSLQVKRRILTNDCKRC